MTPMCEGQRGQGGKVENPLSVRVSGSVHIGFAYDTGDCSPALDAAEGDGAHHGNGSLAGTAGGPTKHRCVWKFRGVAGPSAVLKCDHPLVLKCTLCPRSQEVRCKATRDDRCVPCSERHRKDIARVMRSGVSCDRPSGFFFVTLTGPGVDQLPWDTARCGHRSDGSECSGELGCKSARMATALWNETAPQRWSWFVTEMRRQLGADVQFCGAWETQKRGVLHRHVLMWSPGVSHRRFAASVRLCAVRWGFGRRIPKEAVQSLSAVGGRDLARKAGYCAKYATKGGDLGVSLNVETGEIREGGYRRWSASRRWGTTMRCVRAERVHWAMAHVPLSGGPSGSDVDAGGAAALDLEHEIYAIAVALRVVSEAAAA